MSPAPRAGPRVFAIGTPGLMGSQPFGAGQAPGGAALLVCVESFAYAGEDGTTVVVSVGTPVDPSDPVVSMAPDRFADASTARYTVAS